MIAVFRLAIAEATRAPEVAQTLDAIGREAGRAALHEILIAAHEAGLVDGEPESLVAQFLALLWGDLLVSLLLGVAERPGSREMTRRAGEAAEDLLRLHPTRTSVRK